MARSEIDAVPSRRARVEPKELRLATQIIDALEAQWKPSKYHDTYTEELRELIERRAKGETITIDEKPAESAKVLDLMAALSESVAAAKRGRRATPAKRTAKRTPAKRTPAKRTPAKRKTA